VYVSCRGGSFDNGDADVGDFGAPKADMKDSTMQGIRGARDMVRSTCRTSRTTHCDCFISNLSPMKAAGNLLPNGERESECRG